MKTEDIKRDALYNLASKAVFAGRQTIDVNEDKGLIELTCKLCTYEEFENEVINIIRKTAKENL